LLEGNSFICGVFEEVGVRSDSDDPVGNVGKPETVAGATFRDDPEAEDGAAVLSLRELASDDLFAKAEFSLECGRLPLKPLGEEEEPDPARLRPPTSVGLWTRPKPLVTAREEFDSALAAVAPRAFAGTVKTTSSLFEC